MFAPGQSALVAARWLGVSALLVASLAGPPLLSALQLDTRSISGTVVDHVDRPLTAVRVIGECDSSSGGSFDLMDETDSAGRFSFPGLPAEPLDCVVQGIDLPLGTVAFSTRIRIPDAGDVALAFRTEEGTPITASVSLDGSPPDDGEVIHVGTAGALSIPLDNGLSKFSGVTENGFLVFRGRAAQFPANESAGCTILSRFGSGTLDPDSQREPSLVLTTDDLRQIDVTLEKGLEAPGAVLYLQGLAEAGGIVGTWVFDGTRFAVPCVLPGTYELEITSRGALRFRGTLVVPPGDGPVRVRL